MPKATANPAGTATTSVVDAPAWIAVTNSWRAPMMAMNTAQVATMPPYFPRRNSNRAIGFGRMTYRVLRSISL